MFRPIMHYKLFALCLVLSAWIHRSAAVHFHLGFLLLNHATTLLHNTSLCVCACVIFTWIKIILYIRNQQKQNKTD
jgi:hypothetical protein